MGYVRLLRVQSVLLIAGLAKRVEVGAVGEFHWGMGRARWV